MGKSEQMISPCGCAQKINALANVSIDNLPNRKPHEHQDESSDIMDNFEK